MLVVKSRIFMPFLYRVYLRKAHNKKEREQCCTFRMFGTVILLETTILVYSLFSLVTYIYINANLISCSIIHKYLYQ